jgi:hypothetical protein
VAAAGDSWLAALPRSDELPSFQIIIIIIIIVFMLVNQHTKSPLSLSAVRG